VANHKPQNSPKSYLSYTVYKGTPPLTAYMKRHRGCACLSESQTMEGIRYFVL